MDFKVEGPRNNEKYYRPPWLADKKNVWILDPLEWLKQKHFRDSLLIVSVLKLFLFFLCVCVCVCVCVGVGGWVGGCKEVSGVMPLPAPSLSPFLYENRAFFKSCFCYIYGWLLSTWPWYILWIINDSSRSHHVLCRKHVFLL